MNLVRFFRRKVVKMLAPISEETILSAIDADVLSNALGAYQNKLQGFEYLGFDWYFNYSSPNWAPEVISKTGSSLKQIKAALLSFCEANKTRSYRRLRLKISHKRRTLRGFVIEWERLDSEVAQATKVILESHDFPTLCDFESTDYKPVLDRVLNQLIALQDAGVKNLPDRYELTDFILREHYDAFPRITRFEGIWQYYETVKAA